MSHFRLTPVRPPEARIFCSWTYGPGYGLYDLSAADLPAFLLPRLNYHAVRRDGELVGFACYGEDAQVQGGPYGQPALDLGCGMDPALVGMGLGRAFFGAVADFAVRTYAPPLLRLSVALSNRRAVKVYESSGFSIRCRFPGMTRGGIFPFVIMTRPV